jgi:GNAT superfamily N-acetyltransferase
MIVRPFQPADAPLLCEIFYRSVHEVAIAKYSREQVDAWAPQVPDHTTWLARMRDYETYVAENDEGTAVGWIAMSPSGYIDMLFCLPEATRCGVASALYAAVERAATRLGLTELTAHASFLAQSFFIKHGWTIDERETVVRNGVELERVAMSKRLIQKSA